MDGQTHIHTNRHADMQTDTQIRIHAGTNADRYSVPDTDIQTDSETDRQTGRQAGSMKERTSVGPMCVLIPPQIAFISSEFRRERPKKRYINFVSIYVCNYG